MTLALALLLCALSMTSCKVRLEVGESGIYDEKNDVRYIYAPPVYEAVDKEEEYGTLKLNENVSIDLFTIPDTDPIHMLTTTDLDILHASDLPMPTLAEMNPSSVHICVDGSDKSYELFAITDPASIEQLVQICSESESLYEYYPAKTPTRNYRVRFASETYTGIYYTLTYVEYASDVEIDGVSYGKYFFLHTTAKIFIPAGDIIHTAGNYDEEDTSEGTD